MKKLLLTLVAIVAVTACQGNPIAPEKPSAVAVTQNAQTNESLVNILDRPRSTFDDDTCNPRWQTTRKLSADGQSITFTNKGCAENGGAEETYVFALFKISDGGQTLVEVLEASLKTGQSKTLTFQNRPTSCYQTDFYGGVTRAQLPGNGPWTFPGLEGFVNDNNCVKPPTAVCQPGVTGVYTASLQSTSFDVTLKVTFNDGDGGGPVTGKWGDGESFVVASSESVLQHKYGRDSLPRSFTISLTLRGRDCSQELVVNVPGHSSSPQPDPTPPSQPPPTEPPPTNPPPTEPPPPVDPPPPPPVDPPVDPPPVVDVCPNLAGNQTTVPEGYILVNGICVLIPPPPPPPPPPPQDCGTTSYWRMKQGGDTARQNACVNRGGVWLNDFDIPGDNVSGVRPDVCKFQPNPPGNPGNDIELYSPPGLVPIACN